MDVEEDSRSVDTDDGRAERQREIDAQKRDDLALQGQKRKNADFCQVYPKGWARLRGLLRKSRTACDLYCFLAENLDHEIGAVVADQALLARELEVSVRTIRRTTAWLEEIGALCRIRVGSGVYAYALSPDEVWKSYTTTKPYAAFNTRTLVRHGDNEGDVRRRIKTMLSNQLSFDDI